MPNVPGQNQHVIRPGLFDFVRMIDGNMSSGQEAPLLVGASIDGIVDEIGPDAAVIEERVSFGRRPVADDRLPLLSCGNQELENCSLSLLGSFVKRALGF